MVFVPSDVKNCLLFRWWSAVSWRQFGAWGFLVTTCGNVPQLIDHCNVNKPIWVAGNEALKCHYNGTWERISMIGSFILFGLWLYSNGGVVVYSVRHSIMDRNATYRRGVIRDCASQCDSQSVTTNYKVWQKSGDLVEWHAARWPRFARVRTTVFVS